MKRWLLVLFTLGCVACSDSGNNDPSTSTDEPAGPASGMTPDTAQPTAPPVPEAVELAMADETAAGVGTDPAESEIPETIVTEEITYTVNGREFTGYIAYDDSIEGQRPGVLVVHEWWGHNDYARTRAEQLAALGYTGFALDMYGAGKVADHPDNAQQFMQEATKNPEQIKARFLKAKQVLEEHATTSPDRTAAIGYCFGGGVVLNMARAGVNLDGVASFHGSLASMVETKPEEITAKILVLHGADDAMIPREQIDAFKADLDAAGADYEFISYPGAMHSFTNPAATAVGEKYDMPLAYDAEADRKSWNALRDFLNSLWSGE